MKIPLPDLLCLICIQYPKAHVLDGDMLDTQVRTEITMPRKSLDSI